MKCSVDLRKILKGAFHYEFLVFTSYITNFQNERKHFSSFSSNSRDVTMLKVLVLIFLATTVLGYPTFLGLIPNGFSVPNPCGPGTWNGVGHLAQGGAGPLNPFGMVSASQWEALDVLDQVLNVDDMEIKISFLSLVIMSDVTMLKVLVLVFLMTTVLGYSTFMSLIPNGFSVPNPCDDGIWYGVGHLAQGGTGPLNPFGLAFRNNGFQWNTTLCLADSDLDGISNGEELGDVGCEWTENNNAPLSAAVGHPGICEPVGSAKCAGSSFKC
ncbi:hypothetical protein RRG08_037679 [Elysia crispata]|uniref:Temptin Cys/Cys disulfide domain-containing protein n=1 Tax=Elysia crispata TaxID=231223 RepID=A0AAE1A8Q0_9GAST|nr:hypothetical protein RRG08_037679 [Elysia crispata]